MLPTIRQLVPPSGTVPGRRVALPFPAKGQGAVAVLGSGLVAASSHERAVPIASVTKVMTAYIVLSDHPLSGDAGGPVLTMTSEDHAAWIRDSQTDLSNIELNKGEKLDEHQLLEALLIPSANDVADRLAAWDAGSVSNFVAKMNAAATRLGMRHTHYADASGVNARSVSTAADQALLATVAMRNPVLRSIVSLPDVMLPVAGTVWNYNPAINVDGIVGVKSGFTQAAGGCLVTAAWRSVGSRHVLVIEAVLGQPFGLWQAATADETLLRAITPHLQIVQPFGAATKLASMKAPWARGPSVATMPSPLRLVGWPGMRFTARLHPAAVTLAELQHGWSAGALIGHVLIGGTFGAARSIPVVLSGPFAAPPVGTEPSPLPSRVTSGR